MPEDSLQEALAETRRAARDLVNAATKLTKEFAAKVQTAADHPQATAEKAARRVANELDSVAKEIERMMRDL